MARITLWPGHVTLPDGTANNVYCGAQVFESTGTAPTNACNLNFTELTFDGTTDEHVIFCFTMPDNYSSGGTVTAFVKSGSATQATTWKCAIAAYTSADASLNAKIFNTVSTANLTTSGTAGIATTVAITPASDSAVVGDIVYVMWGRDPDNASDTSTVDALVPNIYFDYTST